MPRSLELLNCLFELIQVAWVGGLTKHGLHKLAHLLHPVRRCRLIGPFCL